VNDGIIALKTIRCGPSLHCLKTKFSYVVSGSIKLNGRQMKP